MPRDLKELVTGKVWLLFIWWGMVVGQPLHAEEQPPVPKDVSSLLADYQSEMAKVRAPIDAVLRTEGSKIVAQLIIDGKTTDAIRVGEAVERKVAGKAELRTHPELKELLERYDAALANASAPVREKWGRKVDELTAKYAGKNMAAVLALGDIKKTLNFEGTSGEAPPGSTTAGTQPMPAPAPAQAQPSEGSPPLPGKLSLSGQTWQGRFGEFSFGPDGTGIKTATNGRKFKFIWKVIADDKIDYVEINDDGGRMNHRIWTFDGPERSAETVDPADPQMRHTVHRSEQPAKSASSDPR